MAKEFDKRQEQVNIHLLKREINDVAEAIAIDKSPNSIDANTAILPKGVLYYHSSRAKPASWRQFLAPGFTDNLPPFNAQHASAVLFFPAARRWFAVTFGYGRSLLAESALEPDFGLRTALNLCNPNTLRAVNYRTIEERTRIARVQLSEAASVNAFRINMDTDLLRGLEAESKDKTICDALGARWSNLIVTSRVGIQDLPKLARQLLAYSRRELPEEYRWVQNVRRITDPVLIESLNSDLQNRLNAETYNNIRLSVPEIAGVSVGSIAKLFDKDGPDFTSDIKSYLDSRPRQVPWTVTAAKSRHRVILIDTATQKTIEQVSVYRCIVADLDHNNDLYQLVDGEWFRLDRNFVTEVNAIVGRIPRLAHQFPAWRQGEAEGNWNQRACQHCPDTVLLDRRNIMHGGGSSRIEPADILTHTKIFGHAKRRDKSSSGLSHLFSQGVIAATLLSRDPSFRQKLSRVIPADHRAIGDALNGDFEPSDWTICYILLGADGTAPTAQLPFFSKVNLRGAFDQLRLMRYKVGIIGI